MSLNSDKKHNLRAERNAIKFSICISQNQRPLTSIAKKKRETKKPRPKTGTVTKAIANDNMLTPDFMNCSSIAKTMKIPPQNRTNKDIHVIQLFTSQLNFFDELYRKDKLKSGEEEDIKYFSIKEFIEHGNLGMKRAMRMSQGMEDASARLKHIENSINNVFLAHYQACRKFELIDPFPNPGHIVFKHKDPSQNFYIILEGRVGVLVKKKDASLKKEISDLRAVFDHLGSFNIEEETLSKYLNGVPLNDILDSNDPKPGYETVKVENRTNSSKSRAKSVSKRMVVNKKKKVLASPAPINISRAKTVKEQKQNSKESVKFNSLRSRKVRMPGSFLHGVKRIVNGRVHYKDRYIRKQFGGLSIDQLLTGKINKKTRKVVLRKGEDLRDDEEWIDAGKIVSQESDVSRLSHFP